MLRPPIFVTLCLALAVSGGCGKPKGQAPARPTPSPTPFSFDLQLDKLEVVLPDGKGGILARIRGGKSGISAPIGKSPVGRIVGTSAVLYRDGKPATEIEATEVQGDAETRTVTARGGVKGRSLADGPSTTFRSDTMLWRADSDKIEGKGHVLLTQGDMARVPADTLIADTALDRIELTFGDAPATGKL